MNSCTKRDIFTLKLAIEKDSRLSHGAARLGLLICSEIYNHPQSRFTPDEPFPLPWTKCSKLAFGMSQREVYRCMGELHDSGLVMHEGKRGCPATAHYRLVLLKDLRAYALPSSASAGRTGSAQPGRTGNANCDRTSVASAGRTSSTPKKRTSSAQNSSPLTNTFPSEETVKNKEAFPSEFNGSLRSTETSGGIKSSLRSTVTRGDELAALRQSEKMAEAAARHFAAFKKTKGS